MAWVKFERDFDYSPAERGGRVTIAYKAGTLENVTRECAAAAIAAGAAKRAGGASRETADGPALEETIERRS